MFDRNRSQTRSMYRSVRYRINSCDNTKTAHTFRIKRNSQYQSTIEKTMKEQFPESTQTIELYPSEQLVKASYLQSFQSLMQRSGPKKLKRDHLTFVRNKNTKMSIDKKRINNNHQQFRLFKDRVYIPQFTHMEKEVQNSQHPLLAPFNTPYSHLKNICLIANKQLKFQQNQIKQIKADLKNLQKSKNKQIQDIQTYAQEQFNVIRSIIRKNEIAQQQKKLKTKRQLSSLEQNHSKNVQKFNKIVTQSSQLQFSIFSSAPYNLKQKDQYNSQAFI